MNYYLILVDEKDKQWGKLEKILVHELGFIEILAEWLFVRRKIKYIFNYQKNILNKLFE